MDIKPSTMTITQLLSSRCQFSIPRFQREYSWEKRNYQEFFDDMLGCLKIDVNGKICDMPYFLGTMLFIGNLEMAGQTLDVVDGQQRLTIITILFSAISDHFREIGNDKLSERIFQYIMTEDDNGDLVRILQSKTHYPFFSYYIQDIRKEIKEEANSEEEICIQETFEYLYQRTSENSLRSSLYKLHGKNHVDNITYEDILKALRDQVLKSLVVIISTGERKDANSIFEILNAKGKRLASVDLIKNQIFSVAITTEPADFADVTWNKIKDILYSGNETVGMATFFRHYWVSKYSQSSEKKLYDKFMNEIKPANDETYKEFLKGMEKNAEYYMQIVNSSRRDYQNKKQYFWLVQSLDYLSDKFNIVQIRIILMSVFEIRDRGLISMNKFKNLIQYLEGFHFIYNAILSRRANVVDSPYASSARKLRKCQTKEQVDRCIEELKDKLDKQFPSYNDFKNKFIQLKYSKQDTPDNMKVKYIINKMYCYFTNGKEEIFPDNGSIEHILPESSGERALNIGNLILLEIKLNNNAGQATYADKRQKYYLESNYDWVKNFIDEHTSWTEEDVLVRAENMADIYYHKILERN